MTARFSGRCTACGERFPAGVEITWDKASKTASHTVCPRLAAAAVPVVTVPATVSLDQPVWVPGDADESQTSIGRRAVVFLLQAGPYASWQLDDRTVGAAAEACSQLAAQARRDDAGTVEALAELQGYLRGIARARAVAAAIVAEQFAALMARPDGEAAQTSDDAPVAPQAGSQGPAKGNGGGGSKVPRRPRPQGPQGGGFASPDESGQQGSFRRPAAGGLRPLAALSLGEDAL